MRITNIVIIVIFLFPSKCKGLNNSKHHVRKFPDGFLFGTASSGYQIEGSWNADGKSQSIWDHFTHNNPEAIYDLSNGDVAADSYNQYKRDVEMLREMGLDYYRFSLSWSRILPTGFTNNINERGIQYYNNLINEMLKYNIMPMVTLYHFDFPQEIQELGGWTNPLITDWFADFAQVAFEKFGDRVKYWITINEPHQICHFGHALGILAPGLHSYGFGDYLCTKNVLVAHAKVYHIYDNKYRPFQKGIIGISISTEWYEPETNEDEEIAELVRQFAIGQYAHPIFSKAGNYPTVIKRRIAAKSAAQGFKRSRLPELSSDEILMLRGSSDFFGLNHYSTHLTNKKYTPSLYPIPSFFDDREATVYQPSNWEGTAGFWVKVVPWGFQKLLNWIKEKYDNPPIIITENGFSNNGGLNDDDRVKYYRSYLDALLNAIDNGSNVLAYTAWTLMDNFQWNAGYSQRFGLYEVDFECPQRTRTPRKSAFVYKEIVRTRALDFHYQPNTTVMTIDEGK